MIASVLLFPSIAFSATQNEITNSINARIEPDLSDAAVNQMNKIVNGSWNYIDEWALSYVENSTQLDDLVISVFGNHSWIPVVVNGTVVNSSGPGPKPVEICGDGIDNDGDGLIDEGCPVKPPGEKPSVDVNVSKTLRVVAIGDIDLNSGLDKQISLAKKYNTDTFLVLGDYGYKDCQGVLDKLKAADFNNLLVTLGNHDCKADIVKINAPYNFSNTWGEAHLTPQVDVYSIDANTAFDCSSTQYKTMSEQIMSSDAWYKFATVHQPFVTVKSQHGPNGQFNCWNPLFAGNAMSAILQAHNHNYQRIDVSGEHYAVFGIGTHDTGSSMYPLNSNDWNGNTCLKCITGTNGITILDLQIDNPNVRHIDGWFIDMNENVKDKFSW